MFKWIHVESVLFPSPDNDICFNDAINRYTINNIFRCVIEGENKGLNH